MLPTSPASIGASFSYNCLEDSSCQWRRLPGVPLGQHGVSRVKGNRTFPTPVPPSTARYFCSRSPARISATVRSIFICPRGGVCWEYLLTETRRGQGNLCLTGLEFPIFRVRFCVFTCIFVNIIFPPICQFLSRNQRILVCRFLSFWQYMV